MNHVLALRRFPTPHRLASLAGAVLIWVAALHAGGASAGALAWLLIGAPVVEEAVWRGGLLEALRRHGPSGAAWQGWGANVVVSVLFAAVHSLSSGGAVGWATGLPSLVLGWVYQQTGRLAPAVVLHAVFNLAWLLVLGPVFRGLQG